MLGITNHGIIRSIYFFDPNGHRVELTTRTDKPGEIEQLNQVSLKMIEEWSQTKRAPKYAAWLHEKEFETAE